MRRALVWPTVIPVDPDKRRIVGLRPTRPKSQSRRDRAARSGFQSAVLLQSGHLPSDGRRSPDLLRADREPLLLQSCSLAPGEIPMPTPPPAKLLHPGFPTTEIDGLRQRDDELPSTIHTGITARTVPVPREEDLPRIRGYEVLKPIGRGGMGIVYEARHRELGRRVAI